MIIGHKKILEFLSGSIKSNRLAHAYLFVGPSEIGKKKVALEFIKAIQCQKPEIKDKITNACGKCFSCVQIEKNQHPDVVLIEPSGQKDTAEDEPKKAREIKIEAIRQLQHQVSLSPFSAKHKAIIIDQAEKMNQEAANCLLKTLEEPPQKSILILVSSNWQWLLPTIISRCQLIKFSFVGSQTIKEGITDLGIGQKGKIDQAIKISCGRPGRAIRLLSEIDLWRVKEQAIDDLKKLLESDISVRFKYSQKLSQDSGAAQEILGEWTLWFRDQILIALGLPQLTISEKESIKKSLPEIKNIVRYLEEAQGLLSNSSFNAKLILDNLILKI
ncbi:MAG: DNA polymerase III subunit delta' [Candidatus Portnoybacteria bacterium]|nr:DNA polymerase III subunit delta' [Candidatus Portnoybacteria bacterium]